MYFKDAISAIGHTPLVELNQTTPNKKVRVLAKLEGQNLGGSASIKDRVAKYMLEKAEQEGKLTKDKIELYCSTDGKIWKKDLEKPRKGKFKISKDANVYVVLGNGSPGEKPFFANPEKKHFRPETRNPTSTFFSDLIVGTDE